MRIFIIGGGIAGFAAALAARKVFAHAEIILLEKESLPFSFASSRNAAIARSYEADPIISLDVKRSLVKMIRLSSPQFPLLQNNGLLIKPLEYDYYEDEEEFSAYAGLRSQPSKIDFSDGSLFSGKLLRQNGTLDIHLLQKYFLQQCKEKNIKLQLSSLAQIKILKNNSVKEITINNESVLLSQDDLLLIAAGSWSRALTEKLGDFFVPLIPHKRHLFFLKKEKNNVPQKDFFPHTPILWDEAHDFYVRYETGGLLATHGDQTPCDEDDFSLHPEEPIRFEKSALSIFPWLGNYALSRYWACVRTFALDGRPAIGFDPQIKNLFWLAGLGGRGMSLAFMLAELAAARLKVGYQGNEEENENPYSLHRFR